MVVVQVSCQNSPQVFASAEFGNRVSPPCSTFFRIASSMSQHPLAPPMKLNSAGEERKGERYAARPVFRYAGLRICPASLLISSLRSASSVLPAIQEMAFDNRHMVLPAGMLTVSSEL